MIPVVPKLRSIIMSCEQGARFRLGRPSRHLPRKKHSHQRSAHVTVKDLKLVVSSCAHGCSTSCSACDGLHGPRRQPRAACSSAAPLHPRDSRCCFYSNASIRYVRRATWCVPPDCSRAYGFNWLPCSLRSTALSIQKRLGLVKFRSPRHRLLGWPSHVSSPVGFF